MTEGEREGSSCPWCGATVRVARHAFSGRAAEDPFLRCRCGAVGLPSLEPETDRGRVAEELLGMSRPLWPDRGWGVEKVEWQIAQRWRRLPTLEALVSGSEIWVALVWGRKK